MGRQLGIQFLTRVVLLVAMFVGLVGFVLTHTVREANRVEAVNGQRAIAALIQTQIDQVAMLADDNGRWDDASDAVYGRTDEQFIWDNWGISTEEEKYYETAGVVDADGKTRFAYDRGKLVPLDLAAALGPSYEALVRRAVAGQQGAAGLVRFQNQPAIAGVADIVPTSRIAGSRVPSSGPSKIVFIRPLTLGTIAGLGNTIMVRDLRLEAEPALPASHTLRDATGKVIGHLAWAQERPGDGALKRALPVIAAGFLLYLFAVALLVGKGFEALTDLGRQALVDSLSTLPNRRSLKRKLEAHNEKGDRVALAMMDLDGFKAVNDNFGHPVGDRLICEVADLLRQHVSGDGMIARLGGDEFAILLSGWDAGTRLEDIAERIITRFAQPFRIDDRTLAVGISIGLCSSETSTQTAGELMRRADVALYAAKRGGKMRFHWFDERLDLAREKASSLSADLREALDEDQFSLVYQPQLRAADRSIASVEALLRWQHPERGDIPPSDFIPVASETGLIDKIGLWVIERACTDAKAWPEQRLTINISEAQLRNPDFAQQVRETLTKAGYPAGRLQFEVTEGWLVRDPAAARQVIENIRALGISVVLDDFGSGFASAGILRSFPFTGVKIHRSLVAEAETGETARVILNSSVAVARALGLHISAAGIETEAQADLMQVAGCEEVQGWHFGKAVTARELTAQIGGTAKTSKRRARA